MIIKKKKTKTFINEILGNQIISWCFSVLVTVMNYIMIYKIKSKQFELEYKILISFVNR